MRCPETSPNTTGALFARPRRPSGAGTQTPQRGLLSRVMFPLPTIALNELNSSRQVWSILYDWVYWL